LSRFISISDRSEELMAPYLPAGARIHRVDNPVDLPRQVPANVAANEHVCYVGRFSPEKGPVLLAESATDAEVKVIFVGDGAERERIASAAPGAEFTGWLNANAVRSVMCRSRALVLPSLWYETQGMVVAEAAALGVPAVVPSESAARQWVEDGVTGLIFRHGDRRDLADKLRWLRENPEGAAAMGQAAYERYWQAPATMESHCEALERVYRSMVEEERQGGASNRDRAHRFETQPVP
jgi:glycosyltransferase involved in cell wall biosynthesis